MNKKFLFSVSPMAHFAYQAFYVLLVSVCQSFGGTEIDYDAENQTVEISFLTEMGKAYVVNEAASLDELVHAETIQGVGGSRMIVRPVVGDRYFWDVAPYEAVNVSSLTEWRRFVAGEIGSYHVGLIGDSFTHTNYRYALQLALKLQAQYGNLG